MPETEESKFYVEDLRTFLKKGELPEMRHFIQSFVKEAKVFRGEVGLTYTAPMPPSEHKNTWAAVQFTKWSGDPDRIRTGDLHRDRVAC